MLQEWRITAIFSGMPRVYYEPTYDQEPLKAIPGRRAGAAKDRR